jgi:Cu/Ag efflux protein CusF
MSIRLRSLNVIVAVVVAALAEVTAAAQAPVSQGAVVTKTFVIDAIDYSSRRVTLRDEKGLMETIVAGPQVERFDALKVGDNVTFRYHESMVYAVRRPGTGAKPAESAGVVRTPGERPGGTISQQLTATVTIEAIDMKVPSVTVKSDDGRRLAMKVENPKNLEGFKVGDRVEITYTQALAISVTPPGK